MLIQVEGKERNTTQENRIYRCHSPIGD